MTGEPYIPEQITVHLGSPSSDAENVTVGFADYIKNVASSEIYPTWPENSIRANIYAIVSFALNRVYTEWYRSKGYNFDITSSTQFDMKYIHGRIIFEDISRITDELFNDYIRKTGSIEPFFASFCNGTTVTCSGLSQWGTVNLAEQGYIPYNILTYYYGDDINIVFNAEVRPNIPSYTGTPLRTGSTGNNVSSLQTWLNRVSTNYPAIPKIFPVDGIYGDETAAAVRAFQQIFNLSATGITDKATWYKILYIYVSVKRLAELSSEGISVEESALLFPETLEVGMSSPEIRVLQYYLATVGAYYEAILPVDVTGYFGESTEASVKSFQKVFGLPQTGVVDNVTWEELYRAYSGIVESVPLDTSVGGAPVLYSGVVLKEGATSEYVKILQQYLSYIHETYSEVPAVNNTGYFGPLTKTAVSAFQRRFGLPVTGTVGAPTWNELTAVYSDLRYGYTKQPYQHPGYTIK